jgi:hypothetical protein
MENMLGMPPRRVPPRCCAIMVSIWSVRLMNLAPVSPACCWTANIGFQLPRKDIQCVANVRTGPREGTGHTL